MSRENIHRVKYNDIYIPTDTYRHYFKKNFCIIYPKGTKQEPYLISYNEEFEEPNPFPGFYIYCIPEVLYAEEWGDPGWTSWGAGSYASAGIKATQFKGKIHIITGTDCILEKTTYKFNIQGYPWETVSAEVEKNIPFRVKVFKIGVMD